MDRNLYVSWNSAYSIGIPIIDEQHNKWLGILNDFHSAVKEGIGPIFVLDTLKAFNDYSIYHFKEEEELFKKYKYPKSVQHIKIHQELVWNIAHLYSDFDKNKIIASMKTLDSLKDWLIRHILGVDKEFGEYIHLLEKEIVKNDDCS